VGVAHGDVFTAIDDAANDFGSLYNKESDQFAALSDRALNTKSGSSTLTAKCGD
jgi:hypothetical protein